MKIFRNDAVYVQKNDIAYLNNTDLSIPASIFMKVFGSEIVIIDDSNRYDFIDFTEPKDILMDGHKSELTAYKGIMISKANAQKEMFKIDLLSRLENR